LCDIFKNEKIVLPSLAAFEATLKNPTVYYVFYDYFVSSCVGDIRWKESIQNHDENGKPKDDMTIRIVNEQTEAFALVVFRNNYFAWLAEMKEVYGDELVTDYNEEALHDGTKTVADKYPLFDLKREVQGLLGANAKEEDKNKIVYCRNDHGWDELNEITTAQLQKNVEEARQNNAEYKNMMAQIESLKECGGKDADGEKKRQRRRIPKKLREYTLTSENERAFKGWSERALKYSAEKVPELRKDDQVAQYKIFSKGV
jgi:hypothetical protein